MIALTIFMVQVCNVDSTDAGPVNSNKILTEDGDSITDEDGNTLILE